MLIHVLRHLVHDVAFDIIPFLSSYNYVTVIISPDKAVELPSD